MDGCRYARGSEMRQPVEFRRRHGWLVAHTDQLREAVGRLQRSLTLLNRGLLPVLFRFLFAAWRAILLRICAPTGASQTQDPNVKLPPMPTGRSVLLRALSPVSIR